MALFICYHSTPKGAELPMYKGAKQRFDIDPVMKKISPYIPDDEIDFLFPFRTINIQGRKRTFKASQLYRAHILTMIKEVTSFNKLSTEFKSRRSFRDFCRFRNKNSTPSTRTLSEFREYIGPSGFRKIAQLVIMAFLNTVKLPIVTVAVPDATDMPARCKGFAKKNAHVLRAAPVCEFIQPRKPPKVKELKRAVKAHILFVIRSIPYVSGLR